MKKALKFIGISLLILILFRGWIYRNTINYNQNGARETITINNQDLINKIESSSKNRNIDLEGIIQIANSISIEELSFSENSVSNNPNELIRTKRANCIGYSALFNSIANYLILKNKLEEQIEAKHLIGELNFLGIDLHQFFEGAFFRDHDFNMIKELKDDRTIFVDPSISDYLGINSVSSW